MTGYLWKATARNVNRALKEINAFECIVNGRGTIDLLVERHLRRY
jgi:hypothetical protein